MFEIDAGMWDECFISVWEKRPNSVIHLAHFMMAVGPENRLHDWLGNTADALERTFPLPAVKHANLRKLLALKASLFMRPDHYLSAAISHKLVYGDSPAQGIIYASFREPTDYNLAIHPQWFGQMFVLKRCYKAMFMQSELHKMLARGVVGSDGHITWEPLPFEPDNIDREIMTGRKLSST